MPKLCNKITYKQAGKLKSCKMKNEGSRIKEGFDNKWTSGQSDICDCRVAFATEKTYQNY